jgi:hypothetical protein
MTTQEFRNKYIGQLIDYDNHYGGQCFDVINHYILEITGVKPIISLLKASDIYKIPSGIIPENVRYQQIENTVEAVPEEGDILVWDDAPWNGDYGHTAIVLYANENGATVIQQNGLNPEEGCREVYWNFHAYNPIGWLRLDNNNQENMLKQQLIEAINSSSVYSQEDKNILINAANVGDMSYIIAFSGSEPRTWLNATKAENENLKKIITQNGIVATRMRTLEDENSRLIESNQKYKNVDQKIKELEKEVLDYRIKYDPNQFVSVDKHKSDMINLISSHTEQLSTKIEGEKWNWNKFIVGLSKWGVTDTAITQVITLSLIMIVDIYIQPFFPNLTPIAEIVLATIGLITGISIPVQKSKYQNIKLKL